MEGVLVYTIGGVERKFICKTFAVGQVLKALKITIGQLTQGTFGTDSSYGDMVEATMLLMYYSAVSAANKEGKPVDFTPESCYDWIDSEGGLQSKLFVDFQTMMLASLGFKADDNRAPKKAEKKSQAKT